MTERTTTITVVDQDTSWEGPIDCGSDHADGSLDRVIASFVKARESIPEQYRAKARCKIDALPSYEGSACVAIGIEYDRPMTREEVLYAEAEERKARATREEVERRHYERLRVKYGDAK